MAPTNDGSDPLPERFAPACALAVARSLRLADLAPRLREEARRVAGEARLADAGRLLLSGSGDSLFAARGTLPAIRRLAGLPAEALTAMALARYETPLLSAGDRLIAVSNSGSSARARETVALARACGIITVGVTGSSEGPLAAAADHVLHRPVARLDGLPPSWGRVFLNLAEYLASLVALYELGLAVGERRGRLDRAEGAAWRGRIAEAVAALPGAALAIEPAVAALAEDLAGLDTLWVIGAGPNLGTAQYSAAKCHEQMPLNGVAEDLEEWAHLQYFLTLAWRRRAAVVVLAPPGNAVDRAEELVAGIVGAGGRAIVAAAPGRGRFPAEALRLDLPPAINEFLTPILFHLPVQLLVLHLARRAGLRRVPLARQDDYWLIRKGLVREHPAGLT